MIIRDQSFVAIWDAKPKASLKNLGMTQTSPMWEGDEERRGWLIVEFLIM